MEEAQRLEIAERITELRERGPFNQPAIAEKLGIRLRSYQKVEKVGTTQFERCEELAEIHRGWTERSDDYQHVSAQWIWDGKVKGATPDVMGILSDQPAPEEFSDEDARLLSAQLAALHVDVAALAARIEELWQHFQEPPEELREDPRRPPPSG